MEINTQQHRCCDRHYSTAWFHRENLFLSSLNFLKLKAKPKGCNRAGCNMTSPVHSMFLTYSAS